MLDLVFYDLILLLILYMITPSQFY